ncbi:Asp23/Gls24 family envelope stress response protein [Paenibacillus sp. FSL R7-0331]|uniref:Asp23/Gls24 family envelope stress response protein n=1 Tax=Paenibacillus sp. FSL R7-0331 TaxID=1536773 RepID=UPI0004F8AF7F|nr:Asp23/Gls24 family envelope stress response protein [Paenibacillus sp. FSL R7-0331]AIQ52168.1 hypothetical protein R70331_12065 [Paenibacillus sp. FSL R7-0331]
MNQPEKGISCVGKLTVSQQVISKIAGMAVQEAEAVQALVEGSTKRKKREEFYKAIKVKISGSELSVQLFPIITLGTPLHQLAQLLQQSIKSQVEKLTGLQVTDVNVTVVGVVAAR